jgi:hypothetical protein
MPRLPWFRWLLGSLEVEVERQTMDSNYHTNGDMLRDRIPISQFTHRPTALRRLELRFR